MESPSVEQISKEVIPLPKQAQLIVVKDQDSLGRANQFFLDIKAIRKKIDDTFSPIISAARKAHQEAIAQRKKIEEPLIIAEKYLNGQVIVYTIEQEKKRAEEKERLRQEAIKQEMDRRKKEEDERIRQAAELEAVGAVDEAEALMVEAIEEKEKPIEIYAPPPETPKVKLEGASIKEYWSAQVTDLKSLCKAVGEGECPIAYIEANMSALNDQARSLKKEMNIPGVKAISMSSMASTGRYKTA